MHLIAKMSDVRERSIIYIFIIVLLSGCESVENLGIKPFMGNIQVTNKPCKVTSMKKTGGLEMRIVYNGLNPSAFIGNLPDFDKLTYNSEKKLISAVLGEETTLEFVENNKGNITEINFKGVEAAGAFNYPTILTYDAKDRLSEISLQFPTLSSGALAFQIEYNNDDNITKIKQETSIGFKDLLVNHSFDDMKSPFRDQKIGQVLSYLMVYSLTLGHANYSYFLSRNNVTSATVTNNNGRTELGMEYEYNSEGFPTDIKISKTFEGRVKAESESFTYDCF
ncbi:MAG: hypothetical protein ACI9IP_002882 [Arcticibacterium sp.]